MAAFLDGCRFNPTAGGTTDWTYSSAVTGYQSPAAANVVNGRLYKYRAESSDLSQWELGEGAYNTSTGVLARTTVLYNSSGGTSKINFTTVPQVAVVALKEDLISVEEANGFTATQQAQARANINAGVNIAYGENTAWTTGTTSMAGAATTVPQSTDGTQIVSASHAASISTNKVLIRVSGIFSAGTTGNYWVAIFQGATAAAVSAQMVDVAVASGAFTVSMQVQVVAGSTSALTYAVNVGNFTGNSNTWAINGTNAAARLGGSQRWVITVEELKG
jgi:hypothetical protein